MSDPRQIEPASSRASMVDPGPAGAARRVEPARDPVARVVATFDPIGLDEIDAVTGLQDRRDRKYVLVPDDVPSVLATTDATIRALRIGDARAVRYRSVYFDTPDRASFLGAARSRPKRFKVRTRHYGDDSASYLEVKTRSARGDTVKARIEIPDEIDSATAGRVIGPEARAFLAGFEEIAPHLHQLEPTMVTTYTRATLQCIPRDAMSAAGGQRVTIDIGLGCALPDGTPVDLGRLGDHAIVETKSPGEHPGPLDRALWRAHHRPLDASKFAVGMVRAHPGLPCNKWHRILTRFVSPVPHGGHL